MTFTSTKANDINDLFTRVITVKYKGYSLFVVRTAISHCCGMNTLQQFAPYLMEHITDWGEVFDYLATLKEKYDLPWNALDFIFFCDPEKEPYFKPLIEHPYTKEVFNFPSRSGHGLWKHKVSCFMVSLPDPIEE